MSDSLIWIDTYDNLSENVVQSFMFVYEFKLLVTKLLSLVMVLLISCSLSDEFEMAKYCIEEFMNL